MIEEMFWGSRSSEQASKRATSLTASSFALDGCLSVHVRDMPHEIYKFENEDMYIPTL